MADPTKAWEKAFTSGSKVMQDRLKKVHAKNPAFQSWLKSSGHGAGESVKQASKEIKPTVRAKQLAAKSATAYGATKGLAVGGEHGGAGVAQKADKGRVWSPDEVAALNKQRGTEPVQLTPAQKRMAAIKAAFERSAAKKAKSFDVPTLQRQHDDLRDVHDSLHSKVTRSSMDEEVELDEMDKSQPSSSRGAEGLALGKEAKPVKPDKVKSNALKILQKQYKKVKEEVELEEGKYASTIAAIAAQAYEPKIGDKVRTRKGGQIPGKVEKIEGNKVFFRHPEGKLYATHSSNLMREEAESVNEDQAADWQRVQSMEKGSITGGKDAMKMHLKYLNAVHAHQKKHGLDTAKTKKKIEGINRTLVQLGEEVELEEGKIAKALAVGAMSLASMGAKAHTDTTKSVAQLAAERPALAQRLKDIGATGQVPASDKRAAELQRKQDQEMPASERRAKELKKEEVEQIDEIKIPVHLAMAAAKAVNSAIDDKVVAGIENSNARKLRPAAGDANITGRRKIIRNLQKRLHNLKRLPTYKNKEHPRHPETKQKVADTDAKIVQARSELEPHLKQQNQTTDKYNNAVDSDVRTYRNYGLVGLGLKRLKQKIVGEEVEHIDEAKNPSVTLNNGVKMRLDTSTNSLHLTHPKHEPLKLQYDKDITGKINDSGAYAWHRSTFKRPMTHPEHGKIGNRSFPQIAVWYDEHGPSLGLSSKKLKKEEIELDEVTKKEAEAALGGPVKEKPTMPPGKQPAGHRYVRNLARRAMKKGMKEEVEQVVEQDETMEKVEMAQTQLHFICYAANEIIEFVKMGGEVEEWYQNKLSKVHSDMESLHSYIEGEKRRTGMVKEEEEQIDEKAPPGAKYERMVKHIKTKYAKDGLTGKEKSIAYATAWKAYGKKNEETVTEAEGKVAVSPKEKDLAAHHGDPTRITYGDVIKARLKSAAAKKMGK
jgi:hypothetical protein